MVLFRNVFFAVFVFLGAYSGSFGCDFETLLIERSGYSPYEISLIKKLNQLAYEEIKFMPDDIPFISHNIIFYNKLLALKQGLKERSPEHSLIDQVNYALFNQSSVIQLYDKDVVTWDSQTVPKESSEGRLKHFDQLGLQYVSNYFKEPSKQLQILDVGASFGFSSLETYRFFQQHYPNTQLHVVDRNIDNYILFDLKTKKRIFYNAEFQPVALFRMNKKLPILTEVFINLNFRKSFNDKPFLKKYKKLGSKKHNLYNGLLLQAQRNNQNHYTHENSIIVERIRTIHPELVSLETQGHVKIYHQDAKLPFDSIPNSDVIYLANLLYYFSDDVQSNILNNLISKLNPNGILIFNCSRFSEGSYFTLVIQKRNDGKINFSYVPTERYKEFENNPIEQMVNAESYNIEYNRIQQLIQTLQPVHVSFNPKPGLVIEMTGE